MKCPRCGHDNRSDRRFCGQCGGSLAFVCAACGFSNDSGEKFCGECGHPLGTAAPATKLVEPATHTPKHVAETILTSKAALEGERKQVTVLFADLKGSMELLADRDPEEARKLLDPVLELLMKAVRCYDGTVNQVMGDGIMALFGAPLAHEDHAVRACYAALRMQEEIRRYGDDVRRVEGVPIRIRVGLNSGEVVVRAIGDDLHMDYTAVGQTTHLAARMEQIANAGTTLLTAGTFALAEGFVEVRSLGPTPVKGMGEPIEVFELIDASAVRSRLRAAAARGLTKFVGRSAEIAELHDALGLACRGTGQVVAVVAEPGVGKSRLLWELTHSHQTGGCRIFEAAAASYGKATAYYPVIDLLKSYFAIQQCDNARTIREKLTGRLLSLDRALEAALPAMLALLEAPVADEQWGRLDPPQRRRRTIDAVTQVLLRESEVQPVVVVFEDLHWIDDATQALLDALVESLPSAHILLLVSYRPEYRHAWSGKPYYRELPIDPLPPESAEEMLHSLLGGDASLRRLRSMLVERTDGNPLFLEEMVQSLLETQVLVGEHGAHRLVDGPEAIKVPATVQAIISARIDRLASEDKRLLQAASVVGVEVPSQILADIAEISGGDLRQSIARLEAARFLVELRLYPDIEYTFRHALTCEVAYESLVRDRRHSLHGAILEVMERRFHAQLVEHMERLAHHALRGEVWPKAVTYCRAAGVRALSHSANHSAAMHFQAALDALGHLEQTRETAATAIDLRLELRSALSPLGEYGRMLEVLNQAFQLAEQLSDDRRLGLVLSFLSNFLTLRGDFDGAIEHGLRALRVGERLEDRQLSVLTDAHLSIAYFARGQYGLATKRARDNASRLVGADLYERYGMALLPSVYSRTVAVLSLAETGDFAECFAMGQEGLRIAEDSEHPQSIISACLALGTAHVRRGDFSDAIGVLERGRRLADDRALAAVFLELALPLGQAYSRAGKSNEAIRLLERAVALAVNLRHRLGYWIKSGGLGEAYLCSGRVAEALPLARAFVDAARVTKAQGQEAWAHFLVSEVLVHSDAMNSREAGEPLAAAVALSTELGMRPLQGRCHFISGLLQRKLGAAEDAKQSFSAAARIFRELSMPFWTAQAEHPLETAIQRTTQDSRRGHGDSTL